MTDIISRLAELSPERQRLLALKLKLNADAVAASAGNGGGERPSEFPASFAQRRMWLLDRMEPGSTAYSMPRVWRIPGPLDAAALERAVDELVRRHETLRTRLEEREGELLQVVAPPAPFRLEVTDLSTLAPEAAHVELERLAHADASAPFRLETGPLFRASLARLAEDEHALLWNLHHAVTDGWSTSILARELKALYAAFSRGQPSPLAPLPLQYGDHALRERERLSGDALARLVGFWRDALEGAPTRLEIAPDRPRPPVRTHRGAAVTASLDAGLPARVDALARARDATPFMVYLAAFQLLLGRYARQDDVLVGTAVANRPTADVEGIVGFFVNTLVLRGDLSGDPSFAELLARVREATLGAFDHQALPFEKLVEELNPERSLTHAPLVQAVIVLHTQHDVAAGSAATAAAQARAAGPALRLESAGGAEEEARFDLALDLAQGPDGVRARLSYATDLLDEATVRRMLRHFDTLLEAAVRAPDAPLSALSLLDEAEERAALAAAGSATAGFEARALPVLFAEQAARTPNAPALTSGGESITYAELDARANRLARHLIDRGARPDTLVGLLVGRSIETIVGILGILKSGAGYLPLDPANPDDRLAYVLEDSGASLVVTTSALADRLPDGGTTIVRVDADADAIAAESAEAPAIDISPESLAYAIYTSGSTGTPKGVGVPHRAVARLVRGTDFAEMGPEQVFLQLAPVAFDASTLEIWAPLLNGGRLVMAPPGAPSLREIAELVRGLGVTTLWLTAGLFHRMVDEELDALGSLRQLLAGGDVLSVPHVRKVLEAHPSLRLINGYGPTENTTFTCCHTVRPEDAERASIPIGRPIAGTSAWVLDGAMRPCPVGVPGELYAGGHGIARGYLGRPGQTATSFVPDPFSSEPGARLYRTGDWARRREDGTLEFLGRIDQQVKVRGFRIELGEIESVLLGHPAVREAVVLTRGEAEATRLVAWIVASEDVSAAELRAHMVARLPEYMVPSAFVTLDAIPLTRNGKVDRRALPDPDAGALAAAEYVAPRTPTEEVLATLWAQLLGAGRVGATDGFFELGGHSLLATRLVSRVRADLGVELPVRAVFEHSTLAGLAAEVDRIRRTAQGVEAPPIVPVSRGGDLPLSFAQERLWFLDRLDPGSATYNLPVAWRLGGMLDEAALERSLGEIVRRHESLRTVFAEVNGAPVQVIAPFGGFALPVEELSGLGEADRDAAVRRRAGEEARRPFDLSAGPLFRAALLRLGEEEHVLLLSMHHIVSDGWSLGVLFREMSALYAAYLAGGESPLAELAVQYADYSVWQREHLAGEVLDRQLAYWKERLAGAPELLELPTDHPRPAVRTYRGASVPVELSPELLERLEALGRSEGATLYMTLLGAFQVLLSKYGGGEDIVVGSPIAGRTRREVEELIGFFVNTLVLRTDLSGDPSFREVLRRAREVTLGAYEHQEVPFERLVEELQPERSLSHSPLFQVMLTLQNDGAGGAALPGPKAGGVGAVMEVAKFDLSLSLTATSRGLQGGVTYSTDLFEQGTIERMVGHLERVLEQAAADADVRLSRLELLGEAERALVLEEWNRTEAEVPADRRIHELFEAQAARTPGAVAVRFEEESLTYGELNEGANRLAHYLVRLGVGPEVRVGVLMERSLEMVVSLLAVLKAGGAYVPLDPGLPAERLAYMLDDSAVPLVLAQAALRGTVPAREGVEVLAVDALAERLASEPAESPAGGAGPDSLAYVIYTSGSTGRPKGVMNAHRGVVNRLVWMQAEYGIGADDVVLQKTPFGFDVSVWELFWPLQQGATLVMARPDGHRDPPYLQEVIEREGVTTLHFVPSMLQQFVEMADPARCGSLLRVVCSGEALPPALVERFHESFPAPVELHNLYGPTEAAVDVSCWPCPRTSPVTVVPIGRPVWNTALYVLDAGLRPVPVGTPGELYIGGVQVARGYQGRSAMTAERFVPDPFSVRGGARLYRTGDRARWRADGAIEYLGRLDFQVKVRGFRIELGEIEGVLLGHPGVREAVVLAREDVSGDRRLVAYLVPDRTHAAGVLEIQRLEREAAEAGPRPYELPNGMGIVHLNAAETRFLYREIFEDRSYLRHGVALGDGACVFDVGANIGLFTLFAGTLRPGVTVYAFEPIPPVFQALEANARIHGVDARLFNCGVGSTAGEETFTFYPHASVLSGRQVDEEEARSVVRSFLRNERDPGAGGAGGMDGALLEEMLEARLGTERVTCEIRTLSQVIREEGVERIDLLKVDVEGGEYDVLAGIEEEHWERISQVVAEAHDQELERVTELLARHGFAVAVEQEHGLEGTGLHAVYAVRPEAAAAEPAAEAAPARRWSTPSALARDLRELGRERLPEHMVPAAFVFLDALPLTPNGKVDRKALPAPELASAEDRYVAPRTPTEEVLAGIWAEVLRLERVGVAASFFDLGGHSLLATRVVSRIRELFGVELPLRALFDRPTVAELAGRVEEMRRADLLVLPPVVPAGRAGALPLSFAQERLWFLDRLDPGSTTYNIPAALRLAGALDAAALERSLGEIVRRHEALRTVFAEVDGSPVQVIAPFAGFALPVEDLSGLGEAEREAAVGRRAGEEARRPFDLSAGPLFRAALLRLGADDHALLLGMHHIVSDGWSLDVLFRELSALYAAYREGGESPLPELAVQYADYAVWQREQLAGESLDRQLSYWKEHLTGAPELLELPTDHPRPAVQTYRGASVPVEISLELLERLQALGRSEGATLYMTLLGAFQVLLSKYGGGEDVVVGSPIAGRTRGEVEALIGFFVNTLVLRTDLSGDPGFREVLRRVREVTLGAYEHQEVPFEKLVAELKPERSLSHSPLFQVSFTVQDAAGGGGGLPGLTIGGVGGAMEIAKFDLSLTLSTTAQGLRGGLNYNTDLFERGTVERMLGHFSRVLEEVAADADVRLSRLALTGPEERARVVEEWNRTERAYPRGVCVHELFEAQVRERPGAVALAWGDVELTYRELDARANQLAHHLVRLGVGPDARVGVLLERSAELIVSILAVLKAGGCYVPLDPGYPPERLRLMLVDSSVRVLLSRSDLAGEMDGGDLEIVHLDHAAGALASEPIEAPRSGATAENLAYIVYTSGSTGKPKGVMVAHRHVVQLVVETDYVQIRPGDRIAQASNAAFDALTFEAWGAFLNGATLVGIPRDVLLSPPALHRMLREERITTLYQTTALLNQLSRELPDVFAPLRDVLFGGQAVDADSVRRLLKAGGPERLLHMYGPTETTAWCSWEKVEHVAEGALTVSVGRATGNQRIYLLDSALNPVPVGVPGEAYVGGDGVVRGYLDRPGLTAERFVPDPFAAEPGARMYRTGDRLRWKADGRLEFIGRVDEQVKIRGFRIEPGEIEAVLSAHAEVREARVLVSDDASGEKRLVAYVVGRVEAEGLRSHLRESLPEYMVPAAFVVLEQLPLTPNGKLDVRALPAPELASAEERYVAPRTPVEEVLAEIWAEVLRLERVGVTESFFELGGHSLLAIRVVSRIRAVFAVELPLRSLFEGPTVAELARAVEDERRSGLPALPPVLPVERTDALPLSFAQERLWFLDQLEPGSTTYNIPVAWRLGGALDEAALERALGEIVRRHEALRTVFAEVDGSPVQVIAPFDGFVLPVEDLSGLSEADREAAVGRRSGEEAARPFDLSAGPLFRAALLRLGAEDHVLQLSMHHVVSDGWSMGVLLRELSALYAAYREGRESPLAELAVQYADYSVWQREQLEGASLDRQLSYWKEQLAGAPELLELPADHPRPAVQTYRGASVPVEVSLELLERLQALGRSEGATLYMTLLGAFQVLLSKYGGGEDIVVGSPIAGRTRREVEELIGFFVNTLVLRTDLSGDPGFREVLRRVREVTLGAYEHQEVPFEKLVEALQPERSMSHSPLFQVSFTVNNAAGGGGALPGLEVGGVGAAMEIAKFDLSLTLTTTAQGLRGGLNYNTDLFERGTVERMLGHLSRVLEQVAADADVRHSRLALTGPEERARVVEEWNRTERAYPRGVCVHELFEAQVRERPGAVALAWGDVELTYRDLDARANQLAHHLVRLGVGPDARVGVLLERSAELIVSILAVLKAGGCYVPLDPSYPPERLRLMLADSSVRVLLSRSDLAGEVEGGGLEIVHLDHAAGALASEPIEAPRGSATAENLAYIVYTSGSTGKPKGVMVAHRHVVQLVVETDYVQIHPGDRVAQASNASFDALTFEAWGAFLNGATLVGIPRDVLLSPPALHRMLREERITTLYQTTALLNQLSREQPDVFAPLRDVLFGGQAVDADSVRRLLKAGGPERLLHMYGPTETTAWCSWEKVEHVAEDALTVSVGRPTGNQRIYLLDAALNPVPVGVPGEAYVGGDGVVRGYLDRPGLTAERFVPDPFATEPGARMYRTGDRLRWKADGRLEFIGRVDEQVKIRGFRIEPGEIEAVLSAHAEVREARVLVSDDASGEKRLVAYVVGRVEAEELRAHLRESLPEYMVPAAFVVLDALPLTPNGKLDVRALPAPEYAADAGRFVAPRTAAEEVLAGIWADVLRLERVGVTDNFFSLGGHSLLAVTLVSRMRRRGFHADVRDLFTTPTVAELATVVTSGTPEVEVPPNRIPAGCGAITPEMLPLVELTQAEIDRIVAGVPGGAGNVQDIYPLAPLQDGILYHHLLSRESDPYLLSFPYAFESRERLDAYLAALQAVIARHDILRTAVVWEGLSEPVQVVWRSATLPVEEVEVEPDAGDVVRQIHERVDPLHYHVDPSRAPLLRACISRDAVEGRWGLLLLLHHLVSDHATGEVLREELEAHLDGRAGQLPAPLPFRDYVAQARLGVSRAEHEAFFREMLGDVDEPTEPFGLRDVRGDGLGLEQASLRVEEELGARLRQRARRLGVSVATVCHVAWAQVLARVSGRSDVVFGTVLLGRMQGGEGADRVMGPFINTLPVRIRVGEEGAEASVRRTQALLAGLMRHEHASLALAQQCGGVPAPAPLFSALFNYRHGGGGGQRRPARGPRQAMRIVERSNYPLNLSVDELGDGFSLTVQVQAGVGAARVCAFMSRALGGLVEALERAPERPVAHIEVLPEAERLRVVEEWNRTAAEVPADRCIHELFEAQAARTPAAVAVRFEDESLRYGELNERANRLAHYLVRLGVGPEVRVGVLMERSLEMVVSLLAVLKAGGAYVPLDPGLPAERLAYMLDDSGVPLVLAQAALRGTVPAREGVEVLAVDALAERLAAERVENPAGGAGPDSLAYVIYTSGSTGRPKGVMNQHRGVVNRLVWMQAEYGIGASDVVLQKTPFSFDVSVWELFWPLQQGATLVMARPDGHRDPLYLQELIERRGVTTLHFVPSMLQPFVEAVEAARCTSLRRVICSGEALPPALVARFHERFPAPVELHNLYGPTEAAVDVSSWACAREDAADVVPIGRPVWNTRLYVLDAALEPVPVDVAGELYIGGVQVARGYLDRPGLTAERFIPDPFSADPGARLYRTGDRARWRADGAIEYLGRLDFQVKVRGFRIELGEIEAALRQAPGVTDCTVGAREDAPGDRRLVAYVVGGVETDALRAHLRQGLPEYMVPSAFVVLDHLPLTPNGKVDRKALPAPELASAAERYVAPRTPVEEVLAGIWAEVLRLERVGVTDSFFELGGHSLLLMRLLAHVQATFDLEISIRSVFSAPTLEAMAGEIERRIYEDIADMTEDEVEQLVESNPIAGT